MKRSAKYCLAPVLAFALSAINPAWAVQEQASPAVSPDRDAKVREAGRLENEALSYFISGDAATALPRFTEALRLRREVLGDQHPDTLWSLNNHGVVLSALGRSAEAEPLYAEALRLLLRW